MPFIRDRASPWKFSAINELKVGEIKPMLRPKIALQTKIKSNECIKAGPTPPIKYKARPVIRIDLRLNLLPRVPDKNKVGNMNKEDIVTTHCTNRASVFGNATASGLSAGAAIIVPKVVVTTNDNNAILALAFNDETFFRPKGLI
jgi:hypothetical protein